MTGYIGVKAIRVSAGPASDNFRGCSLFTEYSWVDPADGNPILTTESGVEYQMICVEPLLNGVQEDWTLKIHIEPETIN